MHSINKVYTATEYFFHNLPIRQILRELQTSSLCNGQSAKSFFGELLSTLVHFQIFLEDESQQALQNISDAMDCWMEFLRVDPTDLIDDEPYNKIIFSCHNAIEGENIDRALQITNALREIGDHFFQSAKFGPNRQRFFIIQDQFNSGCDQLIYLLKATKTFLQNNYCLCNKLNSC